MLLQCSSNKTCQNHARNCQGTKTIEMLGLEKIESSGEISGKSYLFDPIDMGHQSSITQLKALKQKMKPEDLNPQFYRANREGIKKYEGGVKTLENNNSINFSYQHSIIKDKVFFNWLKKNTKLIQQKRIH